jgi:hypothetical protein
MVANFRALCSEIQIEQEQGDKFVVIYLRLSPTVNTPREAQQQTAAMFILSPFLVASWGYFALFAWRAFAFAKTV